MIYNQSDLKRMEAVNDYSPTCFTLVTLGATGALILYCNYLVLCSLLPVVH